MASSLTPASAASSICIRLSRRTGCLPPLTKARSSSRSIWLRSTRYRTFITISLIMEGPWMNTLLNQKKPGGPAPFTAKQGQYLAFIWAYSQINGRAAAEADFQRYFKVTPPSAHQMGGEIRTAFSPVRSSDGQPAAWATNGISTNVWWPSMARSSGSGVRSIRTASSSKYWCKAVEMPRRRSV
ncbi:hypothetical protein ACVMH6_000051 [Rhizobium leguminosarum]